MGRVTKLSPMDEPMPSVQYPEVRTYRQWCEREAERMTKASGVRHYVTIHEKTSRCAVCCAD